MDDSVGCGEGSLNACIDNLRARYAKGDGGKARTAGQNREVGGVCRVMFYSTIQGDTTVGHDENTSN